jgi:malate dehydrogenase (oxaloacetate-decarboxylating)(NADP+)
MSRQPQGSSGAKQSTGLAVLQDPVRNKGTAFSEEERDRLHLRGLLPPRVHSLDLQVMRVLENLRRKPDDLERYIFLVALQDRNETLFYRVVVDHIEEIMPIIYTPTVGKACQEYGHILRRPRGLYVSARDRGRVEELLRNWPDPDVRVIVVTDGERILGLGDLGADGMGIPVGKLALYTACAGVHPRTCLPVTLDVGTESAERLEDPLYIGLKERRLRGEPYDALVDEFVDAVQKVFPRAVLQLEDFANVNAFRLLERYRKRACVFDDDIQGTGAVALAGLLAALRVTGGRISEQTVLFAGAGEAGVGIANLIATAMQKDGLSPEEARRRCWLVDSQGLVVAGRGKLAPHKLPYAHEHAPVAGFGEAVEALRPTAIIGVSGQPGVFDHAVLEAMARANERPIVFALSNPTSKSECTAEQAYAATGGRAIFASGSPFPAIELEGRSFVPGQGNNAYIFPGVGLGAIVSEAERILDEMFEAAAMTLATLASAEDLERGCVYPPLRRIREVSLAIATAVAEVAWKTGVARRTRPADLEAAIRAEMYEPVY